MKIRIGVDLDTTLNNLEEVWLNLYNKDYNDNLTPKDMSDWNPTKYVKPECGENIFNYLWQPGLFKNLDIKQNARDVMEFLWDHFNVYIVTSAHPNVVADKWAWVEKHLPFITSNHFIPLDEKDLLKLDYLVDDGPHNIENFSGTGILYDAPYNRYLRNRYVRVGPINHWLQIKHLFQEVYAELRNMQVPEKLKPLHLRRLGEL